MIRSLRARLLFGIICGMLILLITFSLIVYAVIHRTLVNQYDASLTSLARIVAASVEQDENNIELESSVQQMPDFNRPDRPTYYELWRSDGTVALKSPLLGEDDLIQLKGSTNTPIFATAKDKNNKPLRVVGLKFVPRVADSENQKPTKIIQTQELALVAAGDISDLLKQLALLRWLLLAASGVTTALSVLIAAVVVRRSLNPLSSIAAEIAAIRENDLAIRVGAAPVPSEIAPIRNRLNDLLSRLEQAFKREKRFTADVAHELRTPLAGIRSTIEVSLQRARNAGEYQNVLSECLSIVDGMQTMVNSLLMIARLDANQTVFRREQVHPAELVNSCWRHFSEKAIERAIIFDNSIPEQMSCESDPDSLYMVLSNLLNNAVEYTNDAGQIWVTAHRTDNSVEITVANTGCKLTSNEAAQVFDCFWRGDLSRRDVGVHCGLGLALVERIIKALGGSATAQVQPGGIFSVRLALLV